MAAKQTPAAAIDGAMLDFEAAVQGLPSAEASIVRTRVLLLHQHGSAIVKRFASNIEKESRLPAWAWKALFEAIIKIGTVDPSKHGADALATAVRSALSGCVRLDPTIVSVPSAIPIGPSIDDLQAQAYGRIMTHRQLSKWWRYAAPAHAAPRNRPIMSTEQTRLFIEDLTTAKGFRLRQSAPLLASCPLGRYIMWSTFDPIHFGSDPFSPRQLKLRELVATLGLDSLILFGPPSKRSNKQPDKALTCVLLIYKMPSAYKPHVPTILEAYAGDGRMNYYFEVYRGQVSVVDRAFPRTLPVPSRQEHQGSPEVVHSIIFGDHLSAPLETADLI